MEIVASDEENRKGWKGSNVPEEHTIRGFWGASIWHQNTRPTEGMMTGQLEFKKLNEAKNRIRLTLHNGTPGAYIDLIQIPDHKQGIMGIGAIHHIAFRTENDKSQLEVRERLIEKNIDVTPVNDRNYFHSIYFREPGNVLFEIATDPPGFLVDEPAESLGNSLMLPRWLEPVRQEIETKLPKIEVPL